MPKLYAVFAHRAEWEMVAVILNETVPALGKERPAIWKMFEADITGQDVVISVDSHPKTVSIAKDTAEFVLDIAAPGHVVSQHTTQITWK